MNRRYDSMILSSNIGSVSLRLFQTSEHHGIICRNLRSFYIVEENAVSIIGGHTTNTENESQYNQ